MNGLSFLLIKLKSGPVLFPIRLDVFNTWSRRLQTPVDGPTDEIKMRGIRN